MDGKRRLKLHRIATFQYHIAYNTKKRRTLLTVNVGKIWIINYSHKASVKEAWIFFRGPNQHLIGTGYQRREEPRP